MQKFETLRQPLMWFWIAVVRRRRARLYCRKSAVILPEERGYIPGRARLYFCNENSGHLCFCLQPRAAHALRSDQLPKIVTTFVYACSQGQRTHSARTNIHFYIVKDVASLVAKSIVAYKQGVILQVYLNLLSFFYAPKNSIVQIVNISLLLPKRKILMQETNEKNPTEYFACVNRNILFCIQLIMQIAWILARISSSQREYVGIP